MKMPYDQQTPPETSPFITFVYLLSCPLSFSLGDWLMILFRLLSMASVVRPKRVFRAIDTEVGLVLAQRLLLASPGFIA